MAYLEIKNLSFSYTPSKPLLQGISFSLNKGEIGVLLGSSGSGKTSCLRCLAGFEKPSAGEAQLDAVRLFADGSTGLAPHKRRIGYLFQGLSLFPHMSVRENIGYGIDDLSKTERENRIRELLKLIGLESHAEKLPAALSGGEKQRVALARALAPKPSMILMDEPFSSLDPDLRVNLRSELLEILKSQKTTALIVTHDLAEAFQMGDKIGVIDQGKLLQWGTPEELFAKPVSAVVAAKTGSCLLIDAKITDKNTAETLLGPLRISQDFTSGDLVKILIRPSEIELEKSTAGPFTVVKSEWLGETHQLKISLSENAVFSYSWRGANAPLTGEKLQFRQLPLGPLQAFRA